MFPLHQCFLTSNSIYLLVFDIKKWREQLHSIDEWVQQIVVSGCNGTRTPIVFVATHRDCIPSRIVESEQIAITKSIQKRFPINRYRGVVEETFLVSCKTREGFPELQEVLERLAAIIQPVGSSQWMRVHEHLQFKKNEKKLPLLSLEAYIKIAEIHGVTDRTERKKMTNFLRCIGTMDYFIDHDSDLRDIVILDSSWLSHEISRWIQNGKFEGNDENLLGTVLHIAEQLGVVHVLQDGTALIPNTLPASKPFIPLWKDLLHENTTPTTTMTPTTSILIDDNYNNSANSILNDPSLHYNHLFEHGRRFSFGYIPDGLFSRIISRILSMEGAELLSVWRYGIVIRLKHQLAMVTHTPVISGHVIHELSIHCQLSETILFKNTLNEQNILNPHELLLYRLIILIQNFINCYFPHLLQNATQWIPCYHCILEQHKPIHYFHLKEITKQNELNEQYMYCKYPHGTQNIKNSNKNENEQHDNDNNEEDDDNQSNNTNHSTHKSPKTTKPLWIPLLIPDYIEYKSDAKWNEMDKPWSKGKLKKLPNLQILKIEDVNDNFFYKNNLTQKLSSSLFNENNEFVSLLGDTLQGKDNQITCVINLSGDTVWIGYNSGTIGVYQISDHEDSKILYCITRWRAHNGPVTALVPISLSKSGEVFVWSSGVDCVIRIWNAQTTFQQKSFSHRNEVHQLLATKNQTNDLLIWSISKEDPFISVCSPFDNSCKCIPLYEENEYFPMNNNNFTNFSYFSDSDILYNNSTINNNPNNPFFSSQGSSSSNYKHSKKKNNFSKIICMENFDDKFILVAKGFFIYVISITLLKVVSIWKNEEYLQISGLHHVKNTNIILCWSKDSAIISVWLFSNDFISNFDDSNYVDDLNVKSFKLIGHSSNIVTCCTFKTNQQIYFWSSSFGGEIIIWDSSKLEPIFCFYITSHDSDFLSCYGNILLALEKQILIFSNFDRSVQACRTLFYKPTEYFFHRVSVNFNLLSKKILQSDGKLFSEYIAPGFVIFL